MLKYSGMSSLIESCTAEQRCPRRRQARGMHLRYSGSFVDDILFPIILSASMF